MYHALKAMQEAFGDGVSRPKLLQMGPLANHDLSLLHDRLPPAGLRGLAMRIR